MGLALSYRWWRVEQEPGWARVSRDPGALTAPPLSVSSFLLSGFILPRGLWNHEAGPRGPGHSGLPATSFVPTCRTPPCQAQCDESQGSFRLAQGLSRAHPLARHRFLRDKSSAPGKGGEGSLPEPPRTVLLPGPLPGPRVCHRPLSPCCGTFGSLGDTGTRQVWVKPSH